MTGVKEGKEVSNFSVEQSRKEGRNYSPSLEFQVLMAGCQLFWLHEDALGFME